MRGLFGVLQLANFAAMDCLPVLFFCANARSFWGVAADELCSDGLPACYVFCANARYFWGVAVGEHCSDGLPALFYVFLRECAVFLGCCSWRTLQRWTACLVLCFFARMCGLSGVLQLANFAAMDCLPSIMFFARMRGLFGVLQLANIAATYCLTCFMFFYANARS